MSLQNLNQYRQNYQHYANLSDAHKLVISRAEATGDEGLTLAVKHLINDNMRMYRLNAERQLVHAPQYGKVRTL